MEEGLVINKPQKVAKPHPLFVVVLIVSILSFIGVVVFGSLLIHYNKGTEKAISNSVPTLPARFLVPYTARTPPKDQMNRGTCWVFGTLGFAEASYRKYGVEKGYLKKDEYVSFSEQAYGIGVVRHCQDTSKKDKYCFAGPAKNTTADGEPEWLYYMRDYVTDYIIPTAVCPYLPNDEDQFTCPDLDKWVGKSPLKPKIRGLETAYTIDSIKRLIYEKQMPLTWSHGVYEQTYTMPCSDPNSPVNGSTQCKECYYPCNISSDGCCGEVVIPGYGNDGIFTLYGKPYVGGGHTMLIIGWNDEFRVDVGLPGPKGKATIGGFIIKNSWNVTVGHSAEFWAQQHSILDEGQICPTETSSRKWLAADPVCMKNHTDPKLCCQAYKSVRGEWVKGATVLRCNPRYESSPETRKNYGWDGCNNSLRYVLASLPGKQDGTPWVTYPAASDGYGLFHLLAWDPSNPAGAVATDVTTLYSTWIGLEKLLLPVDIKGNTEHCGVYFFPYSTFTEATSTYPVSGHDTPSASYMDIEWSADSYLDSCPDKAACDLLRASTRKYTPPSFTGAYDIASTTSTATSTSSSK